MVLTVRDSWFRWSFLLRIDQFLRRGFSTYLILLMHGFCNNRSVSRMGPRQALYRYIMVVMVVMGKETTESHQFIQSNSQRIGPQYITFLVKQGIYPIYKERSLLTTFFTGLLRKDYLSGRVILRFR